ncbi:MAG: mechanosensitive ion channel family protein [Planctomycetota bacterium]
MMPARRRITRSPHPPFSWRLSIMLDRTPRFPALLAALVVALLLTLPLSSAAFGQEADAAAEPEAPAEPQPAADVSEQVSPELRGQIRAEVERIRAEPPIHERPEPWSIPVRELELELQPLQGPQIVERLDAWLSILQSKVRDRNRLEIALSDATGELKTGLTSESTRVQGVVSATAERIATIIDAAEKRGGDVSAQEKYVNSVLGVSVNWADPEELADRSVAWATSAEGGIAMATNIALFLVVLFAAWVAAGIVSGLVGAAVGRIKPKPSEMLRRTLVRFARRTVLIIGFVVALGRLGVDVTPLIAAIGAAGLVIGLALQGTLSNFASGILILINKPYDVGDVITGGGVTGKVEAMTLVATKILTFDNQVMYVPNNSIWNGVITNITGLSTRRVDFSFGIGYADDMDKAVGIITQVITSHPLTLDDPAPTVKVNELADSSVNIVTRVWSKTGDYWDVYWDVLKTVKERFDAEGVGIPFPQRDIHLPEAVRVVMASD